MPVSAEPITERKSSDVDEISAATAMFWVVMTDGQPIPEMNPLRSAATKHKMATAKPDVIISMRLKQRGTTKSHAVAVAVHRWPQMANCDKPNFSNR